MTSLSNKLEEFNNSLTPAEQASFKLILGLSAGQLASENIVDESRHEVTETLYRLCPYNVSKVHGLQYRGRPEFLTDALFEKILEESKIIGKEAIPFDEHYLGYGGPLASEIAKSEALSKLVESVVPKCEPTGIASYIFYRDEGQGIVPHVDTDIFSLNVLLMLEHEYPEGGSAPSVLTLHYPDGSSEGFDLSPGEIVIFLAGTQAHSRTSISSGEKVSILTFGFMPEGAPIENYQR